ncbi:vacuolar fusion protein mon1 [Niveomyces insectorum RCEF 264]|uniref:Vacuolar fusion protein MON1 n=1 Tax=Niveomyces insectorum RCEF 264 TaxID=1081102 RepID=A0A167VHF9_9HYPO|nr:vacuolar fusion protein mon1 [Niveomyces insectorum RCEF 264]
MAGPGDDDAPNTPSVPSDNRPTKLDVPSSPPSTPPPPPLPTRPPADGLARLSDAAQLPAKPTTALSSIDIQTLSFPDGSRGTFSTPGRRAVSSSAASPRGAPSSSGYATPEFPVSGLYGPGPGGVGIGTGTGAGAGSGSGSASGDVPADAMSVMSFAPTMRPPGDLASLAAGDFHRKSRAWTLLRTQAASVRPFESMRMAGLPYALDNFDEEFAEIRERDEDAGDDDEESRLAAWKAKRKHYLILSSAGKPIWSRHGDLSLINSYMGIVQTIISFYEGAGSPLQGFTAGAARFVVATEGPLYLVAVSRLGESDAQLRDQLRALYMQILSTLTLPTLTTIFAHRPSSDLRTPLQGTEGLLASLADSFTRGSPAALLGALECLRLRKAQRTAITQALLKQRTAGSSSNNNSSTLLYGLLVAGGKLVSVVRPRKHSLHPSDLQLIFNMLFASSGIQAGGGEHWIPLCLPAFNNRGYLYMYVSFFEPEDKEDASPEKSTPSAAAKNANTSGKTDDNDDAVAIVLISPDKESFFELQAIRNKVAQSLTKSGSLAVIRAAAAAGRPQVDEIVRRPGTAVQISHFLYKSRANVQFVMSSLAGGGVGGHLGDTAAGRGGELAARRRLMTLYHQLHAAVHTRHAHLKILHCVDEDATSLAWVTPVFEFYCVAGPNASRAVVAQDANRIVQWAKREEERLFIIGGGVF